MRYHLTSVKMAISKGEKITNAGKDVKKMDLHRLSVGRYPKERESAQERDAHTPAFITAVLTTAKTQNQLGCLPTDERLKKMWYAYTAEYYSAIKNNGTLTFAVKLMELEIIMLSEICQTQKDKSICSPAYVEVSEQLI